MSLFSALSLQSLIAKVLCLPFTISVVTGHGFPHGFWQQRGPETNSAHATETWSPVAEQTMDISTDL